MEYYEEVKKDPEMVLLIDKVRKSKGISRKQLSVISGVSRTTITEVYTKGRMPSILTMVKIAAALKCKIDDLVCIKA